MRLRRSVVALATVFACLTVMATPVSATIVTFRSNFDSGTGAVGNLRLQNGTAILDVPLGGPPAGGAGCGSHMDSSLDIDSTTTTGTWAVTGFESASRFITAGTHYVAVWSYVSTPQNGTITNSSTTASSTNPAAVTSLQVRLTGLIFLATNTSSTATDCAHGTTLICRVNNITLHFTGTWNNNLHNVQVSDGGHAFSASAALQGSPCTPPFSTFTGGTATISSLPVHVCQVPAPTTPSGSCPTP